MSDGTVEPNIAEIEAQVRAKLASEFEAEKEKIVSNRDQILAEKKELESKFKGLDADKIDSYHNYLKELENNEEMRLISEGKHDEVIQRRMAGREKAWNETQAEYEERLKASQSQAEELSSKLEELHNKNLGMQKRQYLKELVSGDESFKSEHFSHFYDLYSRKADIEEDTGKVFALGDDGKRIVDTDGNFIEFKEFYAKQKVSDGLFWSGGAGSGYRGGAGGDVMSNDVSKWTKQQKIDFINENGQPAYNELLSKK
jgi:hypothetical protein